MASFFSDVIDLRRLGFWSFIPLPSMTHKEDGAKAKFFSS